MSLFSRKKTKRREQVWNSGDVVVDRYFDHEDPNGDQTVITCAGAIDSERLNGIRLILEGKATAHLKPGKREEGEAAA